MKIHFKKQWVQYGGFCDLTNNHIYICRMGHDDHEITIAFSRFDQDGNRVLDEEEQKQMRSILEEKRVSKQKIDGTVHTFQVYLNVHINRVC